MSLLVEVGNGKAGQAASIGREHAKALDLAGSRWHIQQTDRFSTQKDNEEAEQGGCSGVNGTLSHTCWGAQPSQSLRLPGLIALVRHPGETRRSQRACRNPFRDLQGWASQRKATYEDGKRRSHPRRHH